MIPYAVAALAAVVLGAGGALLLLQHHALCVVWQIVVQLTEENESIRGRLGKLECHQPCLGSSLRSVSPSLHISAETIPIGSDDLLFERFVNGQGSEA